MDQEILQLVRSLSRRGLKGLDVQHKRMLLWNRAIKTWNKEHEPTVMGLSDVQKAFVKVWPAIYGGDVEIGSNLYLSVSYLVKSTASLFAVALRKHARHFLIISGSASS